MKKTGTGRAVTFRSLAATKVKIAPLRGYGVRGQICPKRRPTSIAIQPERGVRNLLDDGIDRDLRPDAQTPLAAKSHTSSEASRYQSIVDTIVQLCISGGFCSDDSL